MDFITVLVKELIQTVPLYHLALEALLGALIIWLLLRKSYKFSEVSELTEKEKEELISDWQPEPLVPDTPPDHPALHPLVIEKKAGKHVLIDGKEYLNASSLNFLGFVGDERIENAAEKAIMKYGVGSCGPRGFYGTIDVHLELEKRLSKMLNCEETVLYSYGFPTIASAIPAYAKRGDVIFCDRGVNFAIQKGLTASRSRLEFFNHNDMDDLERLLKLQAERDKHNPKKASVTRRFLIVEGIYLDFADICPLPKLLEFKWKYKVRLFIDETISFGTLGQHGRGVTEHFNVNVEDVDLICGSLENAIASMGGFCSGRTYVVDHQRLAGSGYCFSASSPPFLSVAAIEALNILNDEPDRIVNLHKNAEFMHKKLKNLQHLQCQGDPISPIFHLTLKNNNLKLSLDDQDKLMFKLAELIREQGVIVVKSACLREQEMFPKLSSIRIAVSSHFNEEDISKISYAIETACLKMFS